MRDLPPGSAADRDRPAERRPRPAKPASLQGRPGGHRHAGSVLGQGRTPAAGHCRQRRRQCSACRRGRPAGSPAPGPGWRDPPAPSGADRTRSGPTLRVPYGPGQRHRGEAAGDQAPAGRRQGRGRGEGGQAARRRQGGPGQGGQSGRDGRGAQLGSFDKAAFIAAVAPRSPKRHPRTSTRRTTSPPRASPTRWRPRSKARSARARMPRRKPMADASQKAPDTSGPRTSRSLRYPRPAAPAPMPAVDAKAAMPDEGAGRPDRARARAGRD